MFKEYIVGGSVRDERLGLKSKDIDYVFVWDNPEKFDSIEQCFDQMRQEIMKKGKIYLETPSCLTIRYQDNETKEFKDVVLARKEIGYKESTREPIVIPGTLYDDLSRRDFTVNAIAKDGDGNYIDPFNGVQDIENKILRTPISGCITFDDDPLRLLRAIRFSITKDFFLHQDVVRFLLQFEYENKFSVVSEERIREELYKCFKFNTLETIKTLERFDKLRNYIFSRTNLWLKPTNESK